MPYIPLKEASQTTSNSKLHLQCFHGMFIGQLARSALMTNVSLSVGIRHKFR